MKVYWSGGIAPGILNLGIRCRWVLNFTLRPHYRRYPLDRRPGGPQSRWREKGFVLLLGIERTFMSKQQGRVKRHPSDVTYSTSLVYLHLCPGLSSDWLIWKHQVGMWTSTSYSESFYSVTPGEYPNVWIASFVIYRNRHHSVSWSHLPFSMIYCRKITHEPCILLRVRPRGLLQMEGKYRRGRKEKNTKKI